LCDAASANQTFQVISSIIAAWSDISNALDTSWTSQDPAAAIGGLYAVQNALTKLNIGYIWMFFNCLTSAAFVSESE
jgi:GDP-mannose transporter